MLYDRSTPLSDGHFEEEGFYVDFEAKDILGRGLASTVRKCLEKATGKNFAVKIVDITTDKQSDEEANRLREETESEVALLRELHGHPSIISIYAFYKTPSFLFAVFEMARGELFDELNSSVTVSEKKTRRLMRQLLEGVSFMHSRNIVHRDLKLENILCIDDERIVISDFGFATRLNNGKKLKELCGTPGYLAPETLKCQMFEDAPGYGMEVDNWALGVIMYTLMAGYAPFYHRKQLMMMRMIQEAKYNFEGEQWTNVTADAKNLISGLLVVDPLTRLSANDALNHQWMGVTKAEKEAKKKRDYRQLFRHSIIFVRFLIRLSHYRDLKGVIDRDTIRKRPFRDREIRHETEAAMFAIYGHWVNRGFHYSRDLLFANKPRRFLLCANPLGRSLIDTCK
ncbi:hypothetical protein PRIPAC_91623 [Pristionchus pacificus]|nr:hypothetical protein PRIPAC_91623 [Pristionchus pacificus]